METNKVTVEERFDTLVKVISSKLNDGAKLSKPSLLQALHTNGFSDVFPYLVPITNENEDVEITTDCDLVSKIAMNQVVIQNVLKNLSSKTVLQLRLVCGIWNQCASSVMKSICTINFDENITDAPLYQIIAETKNQVFPCTSFCFTSNQWDSQLARLSEGKVCIQKLNFVCMSALDVIMKTNEDGTVWRFVETAVSKLIGILTGVKQQYLHLVVLNISFSSRIFRGRVINNEELAEATRRKDFEGFPSLKSLTLSFDFSDHVFHFVPFEEQHARESICDQVVSSVLERSPKLHNLSMHRGVASMFFTKAKLDSLTVIPKLTHLSLIVQNQENLNIVCDMLLRGKCQLRSLKLCIEYDNDQQRTLTRLFNMVANTLEELCIRFSTITFPGRSANIELTWPIMKTLRVFRSAQEFIGLFPLFDYNQYMPKLKSLGRVIHERLIRVACTKVCCAPFCTHEQRSCSKQRGEEWQRKPKNNNYARSNGELAIDCSSLEVLECGGLWERPPFQTEYILLSALNHWYLPRLTTLKVTDVSVRWIIAVTARLPALIHFDITVRHGHTKYLDFLFTGIPYRAIYNREDDLASVINFNGIARKDSLLSRKNLKSLTIRVRRPTPGRFFKCISEWTGFHGLALMSHLSFLTIITYASKPPEAYHPPLPLSKECLEHIKTSLATTTAVEFKHELLVEDDSNKRFQTCGMFPSYYRSFMSSGDEYSQTDWETDSESSDGVEAANSE